MKDNLRIENEKYEIMRMSSVKSKTKLILLSILCHQKKFFFLVYV